MKMPKGQRRVKLTIVLRPEVYAALSVYADREGETLSIVAEVAVARYLRAQGQDFKLPIGIDAA